MAESIPKRLSLSSCGAVCLAMLLAAQTGSPQTEASVPSVPTTGPNFTRAWWLKSDPDERSGFLNGLSDCMTWEAHKSGFNSTPEQMADRITSYYRSHSSASALDVADVWQKVAGPLNDRPRKPSGGEDWKNAHWYLNGDWWGQIDEDEELGYVEGYLWCARTKEPTPHDSYSKSPIVYRDKIDVFVKANPKLGGEAVADTLRRFRDKPATSNPN